VADLVGPEVAVDEEQVSGLLFPWGDAQAIAGGQPVALGSRGAGVLMPMRAYAAWVKLEQSQALGPVAPKT
jgi:hypothetical protein